MHSSPTKRDDRVGGLTLPQAERLRSGRHRVLSVHRRSGERAGRPLLQTLLWRHAWVVITLLVATVQQASAQQIFDPENPGVERPEQSDEDFAPGGPNDTTTEGGGALRIFDPENPGVERPRQSNEDFAPGGPNDTTTEGGGALRILDPENPGVDRPQQSDNPTVGEDRQPDHDDANGPGFTFRPTAHHAPLVIIRSDFDTLGAVDFRRDNLDEDVFLWRNTFETRLRIERDEKWRLIAGARLTWWVTARGAENRHPILPDGDTLEGDFEPELRELLFAQRFDHWSLSIGQQFVSWGTSDFLKPADLVNPSDFRRGILGSQGDTKIPIPMVNAQYAKNDDSLQLLFIPFFVEHRFDLYGSDYAVLQPDSGPFRTLNVTEIAREFVDQSVESTVQQPLSRTDRPDARPKNASFGARYTRYIDNGEISFAYLFDWDRFPKIQVNDAVRPLLNIIANNGLAADAVGSLENLANIVSLIEDFGTDDFYLVRSEYKRRHSFITDGLRYVGPVGFRWEAVFQPLRTVYLEDFRSTRKPMLSTTLGVSYEGSNGDFNVLTEGFYQRTFDATRSEFALMAQDFWGVAIALDLGLGAFVESTNRWSDLRFRIGAIYFGQDRDLNVSFDSSFQLLDQLTIAAGFQLVESFGGSTASIGEWLDSTDQFYARMSYAF